MEMGSPPGLSQTFSKEAELWRFTSSVAGHVGVVAVPTGLLVVVEAKVSELCRRRPWGSARITLVMPWLRLGGVTEETRVKALRPERGPISGPPIPGISLPLGEMEWVEGPVGGSSGKEEGLRSITGDPEKTCMLR